jgi:hypothetical protein
MLFNVAIKCCFDVRALTPWSLLLLLPLCMLSPTVHLNLFPETAECSWVLYYRPLQFLHASLRSFR